MLYYFIYMLPNLKLLKADLIKHFGSESVLINEQLARHCNWKVGGPADLFIIVHTAEDLIEALQKAGIQHVTATVLGFGANILISDKGIRGLVILNRAHRISFQPNCLIEVDSGTSLTVLAKQAARNGVGGLEFLIGIPGTVGAAIAVNAGTRTEWMSALIEKVRILSKDGKDYWLSPSDLEFSYRSSKLKYSNEVVISARLKGQIDASANIERNMTEYLQQRKNQPAGASAGSVFKNPPNHFAGQLIEQCGLKGYQIGGAKISDMHANFILNVGGATAQNIKDIIDRVKSEVVNKFGIQFEEEIRYLGDW